MRREVGPGVHLGPHFVAGRGLGVPAMVPFKRATVVSYRLSIVTVVLSLTIRPQFAIECLWHSNHQELGHFGAKFGDKWVDRCKPNFKAKRHMGLSYAKGRYLLPFEHNARATNVTDR